jgi:hypothetical protein
MAESVVHPDTDHTNEPGDEIQESRASHEGETAQTGSHGSPTPVIWRPAFIVLFALMLVFGLSIESILTQGWLNNFYMGQWVFQAYVILICFGWLALAVFTHTNWIRIGAIFGCTWALFMTVNITISALHIDPSSPVMAYVNAATCIALLGSYICLSIDRIPFGRLDAWFFGLAPIAGCIAVAAIYFLTPASVRSLSTLESHIATVALVLSVLVWWIRPTLWKTQPGPTFLFGCVPTFLLLLAIPSMGFNPSNYFLAHVVLYPVTYLSTNEANFFFSQVALLCLLLGIMRLFFCEIRN